MPTVLTLGTFDGVHRGHQALLTRAREIADAAHGDVVVLAFDPHPAAALNPQAIPPRVIDRETKLRYLHECGADRVCVLEPTHDLLAESPTVFIQQVVRQYEPIAIVEGADFRFGHHRDGDMLLLQAFGKQFNFEAHSVTKQDVVLSDLSQTVVSSSLVRWLAAQGRMADVERCLGRPFELRAAIIKGDRRGRTLGIPTMNLDLDQIAKHVRPAPGVYAGTALIEEGQTCRAAISVGDKPTVGGRTFTIEAHLLDFTGDLYGQTVTLRFTRWLRDQLTFPSLDALAEQLQRDIHHTRTLPSLV